MPRDVAECVSMSGKEDHIGSVPLWGSGNREGCHVLAIQVNLESEKKCSGDQNQSRGKRTRLGFIPKLTSVVNSVAVWQCGCVVNTHNEILTTQHRHYRLVFVKTWYDLKYMIFYSPWCYFIQSGQVVYLCICICIYVYVYVYSYLPSLPCFNARKKV